MALKPLKTLNFGGEDTYYLNPDYNNIENTPFGEVTTYGDTLTWDGNTEGLEVASDMFYLVTETCPSSADLQNGVTVAFNGGTGEQVSVTLEDMTEIFGGEAYMLSYGGNPVGLCALQDISAEGETINKGVYIAHTGTDYISSLTVNGYNGFKTTEIKQLDNKYLEPFETVGGDTLTWDGNTEGLVSASEAPMYRISDVVPTKEDCANGITAVYSDGSAGQTLSLSGEETQTCFREDGSATFDIIYIIPTDNYTVTGLSTFPKAGIYAFNDGSICVTSLTINGYTGFETTKLKEEYLPSGGSDCTLFYFGGSDKYIYRDAELTTKLTCNELVNVMGKPIQLVISLSTGSSNIEVRIIPVQIAIQDGLGMIAIVDSGGENGIEMGYYYTAEYTAS